MYFYSTLDSESKKIYDCLYKAICNMEPKVPTEGFNRKIDTFSLLLKMITNDNPIIFWYEKVSYTIDSVTKFCKEVCITFRMSKAEKDNKMQEILSAEKYFLSGIKFSSTEYDKAIKLYENIPRLISYDKDATIGERAKKRKEKIDDCSTIYGALVKRKAVCGGYAKAYQYLLQKFGVMAVYASGKVYTRGCHAWNIVRIDNEWYHIDVTWGDGIKSFNDGIIDYYWFGLTDKEIVKNRIKNHNMDYPLCNSIKNNYFAKNGLMFGFLREDNFKHTMEMEVRKNKCKRIQMRFSSTNDLNKAMNFLFSDNYIFGIYQKAGYRIKSIMHTIDEENNVLTFWPKVN